VRPDGLGDRHDLRLFKELVFAQEPCRHLGPHLPVVPAVGHDRQAYVVQQGCSLDYL
jgi:hypothetical protein